MATSTLAIFWNDWVATTSALISQNQDLYVILGSVFFLLLFLGLVINPAKKIFQKIIKG